MEIDESLLDLDYQPFVTELEQKLISIQKSMDYYKEEISEYQQMETKLTQETKEPSPLFHIGSGCFVQTDIQDQDKIFVHIGYGIHVQFTNQEAIEFSNEKRHILHRKFEAQEELYDQVKVDFDQAKEMVRTLQMIKQAHQTNKKEDDE